MRIDTFYIYYSKAVDKSVNTTQADVMCERCVFMVFSVSMSETNIKTQTEYQVLMLQIFLKAVLYFTVQNKSILIKYLVQIFWCKINSFTKWKINSMINMFAIFCISRHNSHDCVLII